MNWEDARYFLAVARTGKINRAAQNLGISPITLSRRMAHLQDQMKTDLLVRHNQGVELTHDGQRLLEHLERAEAEFDAANQQFDQTGQNLQGTLRIAAPDGFALKILSTQIPRFMDQHPELTIEIVPLPRGFSLSKREADIAILVGKPEEPKLAYELLSEYKLGFYAAPDYLKAHGTPKSLGDLSKHRLVGYVDDLLLSERLNIPRSAWSSWQSQLAIHSAIGQYEAVRAGAGIGVIHKYFLQGDDQVMQILTENELTRSYYIVTHQNIAKLPRIRLATRFLKSLQIIE